MAISELESTFMMDGEQTYCQYLCLYLQIKYFKYVKKKKINVKNLVETIA